MKNSMIYTILFATFLIAAFEVNAMIGQQYYKIEQIPAGTTHPEALGKFVPAEPNLSVTPELSIGCAKSNTVCIVRKARRGETEPLYYARFRELATLDYARHQGYVGYLDPEQAVKPGMKVLALFNTKYIE